MITELASQTGYWSVFSRGIVTRHCLMRALVHPSSSPPPPFYFVLSSRPFFGFLASANGLIDLASMGLIGQKG